MPSWALSLNCNNWIILISKYINFLFRMTYWFTYCLSFLLLLCKVYRHALVSFIYVNTFNTRGISRKIHWYYLLMSFNYLSVHEESFGRISSRFCRLWKTVKRTKKSKLHTSIDPSEFSRHFSGTMQDNSKNLSHEESAISACVENSYNNIHDSTMKLYNLRWWWWWLMFYGH